MRDDFQIWVDAVCEQVRFPPDRKGIAKELRIHYEDHCKDLERLHYERSLAEKRALEAMGNAQEVGRALDAVHKPWLGWLWEASRWSARILAVLVVVTLFHTVGWRTLAEQLRGELSWKEPPASAARVELEHGTVWAAPGNVEKQPNGTTVAEIRFWAQLRDPLTAPMCGVNPDYFSYRDTQGLIPEQTFDPDSAMWAVSRYWRGGEGYYEHWRGWTRFQWQIQLVLDGTPEWVEVSYPLSGQNWVLRVEWEAEP